jgi:alginate O-acetyltransferase complex protein AlgI
VLHGSYIVASLLLQKRWNPFAEKIGLNKVPAVYRALKIGVTFTLVCFAYIFFRAADMGDAIHFVASLGTGWDAPVWNVRSVIGEGVMLTEFMLAVLGVIVVMGAEVLQGRFDMRKAIEARPVWARWGLYYAGAACVLILGAFYGVQTQFIYFRF